MDSVEDSDVDGCGVGCGESDVHSGVDSVVIWTKDCGVNSVVALLVGSGVDSHDPSVVLQ